ncbi:MULTISPECIES: hypothetical protein [Nocardia]|uniref:hypothetical protein n=1 Tax=Nocardia TaxID=1817 RepID=UPI0024546DFF|nr:MULTISPECIES: hypothetical protein [Nocardia]
MKPSDEIKQRMDAALPDGALWTEREEIYLQLAGRAADRAALVQTQLDVELERDEPRASSVVRLSAELRQLERAQADLVARLSPTPGGVAKSERHQRAAVVRWDRARARREHGEVG